jgi:hypothetical protein
MYHLAPKKTYEAKRMVITLPRGEKPCPSLGVAVVALALSGETSTMDETVKTE